MENEVKDCPVETIETLTKEAETLKKKLEDERQKLNDVTCKTTFLHSFIFLQYFIYNCISVNLINYI